MEHNTTVNNKFATLLQKKPASNSNTEAPITPSVWYAKLTESGAISRILNAALNGSPETPMVKTASHVNRSECLKAAKAAVFFAELYEQSGCAADGLTISDFTRLLCRLTVENWAEPDILVYQAQAPAPEPVELSAQERAVQAEGIILPAPAPEPEPEPVKPTAKGKGKNRA